jgi:HSP20 family protein
MLARRMGPFEELFELQRDLMNLFDRVFSGETAEAAGFRPSCEAYYKDGQLVVRAELGGVDPKSVDISLAGRTLTIKGTRPAPEVPADDRIFGEIEYGAFERSLTLPEGLQTDGIKARWHDGILEITIPVSPQVLPKKIPVEVARA